MSLYSVPKYREKYPCAGAEDLATLDTLSSVTDMVGKLSALIELPTEEYKDREKVSSEVHDILKKYYPNCLLVMFGSSINGFGVKNCDLDLLFAPTPEYCPKNQLKKEEKVSVAKSERPPIPDPERILSGETPREDLLKLDDWAHFKFVKLVLRKEKTLVKKVVMIPGKTPTLKIHLINSKFICDFHMSSKLVVFNTELLQFLDKVDTRIKPLVITLCFWARTMGFIKRSIVSNYAFILLVIFYLQNTNPPIVPAVQHLIERAGYNRMSDGWQTAFATDRRIIKKSKNNKTLGELFVQFFEFYWNFDFVQNIVCPNSGKVLPVKAIKDARNERLKDFEIFSLNIQDPFVLSRNVCKFDYNFTMFKYVFRIAQEVLQNVPEKYKFSTLFDASEYQKVFDLHYEKYVTGRPKVSFINLDYDCMLQLSKASKFSVQLWHEKVSQAVYEVLQYGLLIECEVTDKMNYGKNLAAAFANENGWKRNVKEDSKPNSEITPFDLELIQSVQCVVYSRTWMGRKKFAEVKIDEDDAEAEEFHSSALKTEHSVSRELIRKNPLLNRSVPLMCFKCDCYKHTCPQISNVVVLLKPLTLSREFYQVSAFLASYIPKTVKKILLAN